MKKIIVLAISIIIIVTLSACGESNSDEETVDDARIDEYVSLVKHTINDGNLGEGEHLSDVTLENRHVIITVDFSEKGENALGASDIDLAEVRFSDITDAVLEIKDYDDLWDSMTVDYGADIGSITKTKDDIKDEGLGRYFDYDEDGSIGWD